MTYRSSHILRQLLVYTLLVIGGLAFILPFWWILASSLKAPGAGMKFPPEFFPSVLIWSNYPKALSTVPFDVYLRNTLFLGIICVIGAVASSALVAYGFARIDFRGKALLFGLLVATMALPGQVTMIPVFEMFRSLGWYGSYLPLIVPSFMGAPFFVFLLTQFFKTIPEEMCDAARVDGASEWQIFTQIILPLSTPVLATITVFTFLYAWNDFTGPLLFLNSPRNFTMALGLQDFQGQKTIVWNQLMAAATVFTLPIIIAFFFAQKTFIQGIKLTGSKE